MSVIAVVVLWRLRKLTLDSAMVVLAATMLVQLVWAYHACRITGLAPGRARKNLVRPLATYGFAQMAALTPAAVNAQLDQLVLSQTVPAADLGRYAIAVSLTLVPIPLVSAIGYVAFPRLAAQRTPNETTLRVQRFAVLGSAGLTAAMLVPLAVVAYWMVPFVFGPAYRGAVPLLWILTPGSVFLACGGVVSDVLRGRNRPIVVAWSQGLAAVFTVVLLIALLPLVGVYGAAIASTISYGIALAVMLRYLWRLPGGANDAPQAHPHFASPIRKSKGHMRVTRRAAIKVTDLACRALGRHRVLRAGRLVLYRARLDVPNDLTTNGEKNLQRWVAGLSVVGTKLHVVDVGANIGNWSESMISAMRQAGRLDDLRLDAFEPSTHTFTLLSQRVRIRQAHLYQVALSDRTGSSILYVTGLGAGTNSLHAPAVSTTTTSFEQVDIATLDEVVDRGGLDKIALLKVDTEGHDLAVLRGAEKLFMDHRILVVQFEYNHRWVLSRSFLWDAFELLQPKGYVLGKLTPKGVEFYSRWDPDLETFVEGNYVACLPEVATRLPSVSWWKPQPPLN
jgi:FkbM family methyltransferase